VPIVTSLEQFYPKDKQNESVAKTVSQGSNAPPAPKLVHVTMTLDRSAQDITKELKKKLRVLDRTNSYSRNSFGRGGGRVGEVIQGRKTMVNFANVPGSLNQKQMQETEEREELNLFLFKTHARNKMLAFKRILNSEHPLRMLPLDYLETL